MTGESEPLLGRTLLTSFRSDEAYARAQSGQGDADGYQVIETGANGVTTVAQASDRNASVQQ